MKINLDSVNAHVIQSWVLIGIGIGITAVLDPMALVPLGAALFGYGFGRLKTTMSKPNDENGGEK